MLSDQHVMIDVTSLGSTPGSSILGIAIIGFQPSCISSGMDIWQRSLQKLHVRISLESCLAAGFSISPDALKWWMLQPEEVRKNVFGQSQIELSITEGCRRTASFIERLGPDCRVWSDDVVQSISVLDTAMRKVGIHPPWSSRRVRDTRTVFEVAGIDDSWRHEEPVIDAMAQAAKLSAALVALTDRAQPLAAIAA